MTSAFDSIVSSFQELSATVLLTLHTEPRLQTILSLTTVLSPGKAPYLLSTPVNDPDPSILTLNSDLVSYDETISTYLGDREISFIRSGLGLLIDNFLVTNANLVGAMNKEGCGRMQLNILVLQQNLKNIEPDANLGRSAGFYDLFLEGPDKVIQRAQQSASGASEVYNYEELKTLVELCYSEAMASQRREVSTVAKRSQGEALLQLSEYMWQR